MTSNNGIIMIVDDNRSILTALELLLRPFFERIITLNSPNLIPTTLRENPQIDIALLDMNFSVGVNSGGEGLYWLHQLKAASPDIAVVLFTAYADVDLAVRAIKEGASDFVQKPWDNGSLILTLQNALKLRKSEKKVKNMQASYTEQPSMCWGNSDQMLRLREMVEKVAPTKANILIMGENGTGKDMLAREIHALSSCNDQLLVCVDMGAITESLFESELFGHVKGAFTDAKTDRIGKFEAADGGTLFLDEVGNLPYHLQAKLLVALQNRTITRVGANAHIPIDIRLVTATSRNLEQMVATDKFREDLLYRINTITINLPALRERRQDIAPLCEMFVQRYATKYGKLIERVTPEALQKLTQNNWAGNIRELQHTIERAVIMCNEQELSLGDLLIDCAPQHDAAQAKTLEDMERNMIERSMCEHGQNLSAAAAALGITRQTLYNKLKRYNI